MDKFACTPDAKAPLEWEGIDRMPFPPSDGTVAVLRKFTRDSEGKHLLRADVIVLRKEDLPVLRQVVATLEGKSPLGITEAGMLVDRKSAALRSLVKTGSITVNELRAELNFGPHPNPEKGERFVQSDAELAKPFILESHVNSHDLSADDAARIRKEFEEAHRGKVDTILLPPGMELKRIDDGADDLIEYAWGIIANAWGGDWSKASVDWQDAAKKWRDRYHERRNDQAKEFAVKKDHEVLAAVSDAASIVPIPATSADMNYRLPPIEGRETCVGSAACSRCLNVVCQCDAAKRLVGAMRSLTPGSWADDTHHESFGLTVKQESQFQKDKEAAARAHQAAFGTPSKEFVEKVKALGKANEEWRRIAVKIPPELAACAETDRKIRQAWIDVLTNAVVSPQPAEVMIDPTAALSWIDDPRGAETLATPPPKCGDGFCRDDKCGRPATWQFVDDRSNSGYSCDEHKQELMEKWIGPYYIGPNATEKVGVAVTFPNEQIKFANKEAEDRIREHLINSLGVPGDVLDGKEVEVYEPPQPDRKVNFREFL